MHICWRLRCSYALLSLWRRRSGTPSVQESEEPAQSITDKLARMDVMTEKRSVLVSMHELLSNCQPLLQRPDFPINGIVALLMDLVRSALTTSRSVARMIHSANGVSCCPPFCNVGILKSPLPAGRTRSKHWRGRASCSARA